MVSDIFRGNRTSLINQNWSNITRKKIGDNPQQIFTKSLEHVKVDTSFLTVEKLDQGLLAVEMLYANLQINKVTKEKPFLVQLITMTLLSTN